MLCLMVVSYSILGSVERHQLIALIDVEIERLQKARLLVAPSVVSTQLRSRPKKTQAPQPVVKERVSGTLELTASAPPPVSTPQEQPAIKITRMPAKYRARSRSPRRTKQTILRAATALTSTVPLHPVAAPPKRNEESNQGKPSEKSDVEAL